MIPSKRKALLEASYALMRPLILDLARQLFRPGFTMLDIGSGEGLLALKMAADFGAGNVILIDNEKRPNVKLPLNAKFYLMDALSSTMLEKFQNKIDLVTCLNAFHEFDDPLAAAGQLISVLHSQGVAVVFEYTEEGWHKARQLSMSSGDGPHRHFNKDVRRAQALGLDTNRGIRDFWEQRVFPGVPGQCNLTFMNELYLFLYIARQWGEVKEPPEYMREEVERYQCSQK